jgi:hypothetical protein
MPTPKVVQQITAPRGSPSHPAGRSLGHDPPNRLCGPPTQGRPATMASHEKRGRQASEADQGERARLGNDDELQAAGLKVGRLPAADVAGIGQPEIADIREVDHRRADDQGVGSGGNGVVKTDEVCQ